MNTPQWILLLLGAYLSGAVPYAVLLGKRLYQADPRGLGDGNPGTMNAFRLGGKKLGVLVLLCDFLKALIPVALAKWGLGLEGWPLFAVALMPTVGHVWSIFLRGGGGKAIVTLFGVWTALTLYAVPCVMGGMAVLSLFLLKNDALRTLLLPLSALIFLLIVQAQVWMLALTVAQLSIISIKILQTRTLRPNPQ
jgi:glycerol-3-phosphate acyltransferase PlsY